MIGYCRIPFAALAAAMAFASPATAQVALAPPFARPSDKVIMPGHPQNLKLFTEWGLAEAVIDGDRIYLSGVVAGLRPGESDQAAAFDRAFRMVGDVLVRSGSSWDGVVEMTTYHTDIKAQLDGFVAVKHRYVRAPFPAWTAIDVDRLVPDNGLVEIKVVARRKP